MNSRSQLRFPAGRKEQATQALDAVSTVNPPTQARLNGLTTIPIPTKHPKDKNKRSKVSRAPFRKIPSGHVPWYYSMD